jgi:hypothetical protein
MHRDEEKEGHAGDGHYEFLADRGRKKVCNDIHRTWLEATTGASPGFEESSDLADKPSIHLPQV